MRPLSSEWCDSGFNPTRTTESSESSAGRTRSARMAFCAAADGGDVHQAEDLSQEALLRAWRRRWRLRDPRRARVWLLSITVNLWRDEVRRRNRRPARTALLAEDQPGTNVAPAQQLIDRDDVKRALDAMDELPSRQREVLYLHACESLSLAEIAGVLRTSRISCRARGSGERPRRRRWHDRTRSARQARNGNRYSSGSLRRAGCYAGTREDIGIRRTGADP